MVRPPLSLGDIHSTELDLRPATVIYLPHIV
jgi:hypothetical protein